MSAPTPLFTAIFTRPLGPRLTEGAVVAHASIVTADETTSSDLRLADEASVHAMRAITMGANPVRFLIEWPDGSLATGFLPVGGQVLHGMRAALLDAYERGRDALERIHVQHGQHVGTA